MVRSDALTPTARRLIDAAAGIMGEPDPTDRDRSFMARQLVQATLSATRRRLAGPQRV
jgi:hypothetical protein